MNSWAQSEGAPGMGYIIYGEGEARGPVAKALGTEKAEEIRARLGLSDGDAAFLLAHLPVMQPIWLERPAADW